MSETQTQHLDGEPQPLRAEPAATYGINPQAHTPHNHTPRWPLGAKLTVGVLVVGFAAVLATSLVTISSMATRQNRTDQRVSELSSAVGLNASQTSQDNSTTGGSMARLGGSVTSLSGQLAKIEAQLGALSARVSRYGACLITATNNNGLMVSVQLNTPVISGGNVSCPQGVLVLVAPTGK